MNYRDYVGRKLPGYLTVTAYNEKNNVFRAECECERKVVLTPMQVLRGNVHACPKCLKKYYPNRHHDLTGKKFGFLMVDAPFVEDGCFQKKWECSCTACGRKFITTAGPLNSGELYSCPACGAGSHESDLDDRNFSLSKHVFEDFVVLRNDELTIYEPGDPDDMDTDNWVCKFNDGMELVLTRDEILYFHRVTGKTSIPARRPA